jgi:hypothetical protein
VGAALRPLLRHRHWRCATHHTHTAPLDTRRGGRYQGHKKTETFLPVGAIVSVVGELARNTISSSAGSAHAYRCAE